MKRGSNLVVVSAAMALWLLTACNGKSRMQEDAPVLVRLKVVEQWLKVRIEVPAGGTVELDHAEDFSLSVFDPGVMFVIKQGRRSFERCAFVDDKSFLNDRPVVVSSDDPAKFEMHMSSLRTIYCLPEGRFRVRALLVQDDASYRSNEVVIEVKD